MRVPVLTILPALALMAACGGGGGTAGGGEETSPPPQVGPTVERSSVELDSAFTLRYANYIAATDKISLGVLTGSVTTPVILDRNRTVVPDAPQGFAVYTSTGNRNKAIRAVTPSGEGVALSALILSSPLWRSHERLRDTVLPTGRATYSGDYLGTLTRWPTTDSSAATYAPQNDEYISGKVALTADFATATISGTVSSRLSNRGRSFDEIELRPTSITDTGQFNGDVAGGAWLSVAVPATTDDSGTIPDLGYHGLITGADGAEVVGNVALDHVSGGTRELAREVGVFVATAP